MPTHPPIHMPTHLPIRPSIYPSTHPSIHSPTQSICPPIRPSIKSSIHQPTQSICPPIRPSIHPSIHQPTHPATHKYIHPTIPCKVTLRTVNLQGLTWPELFYHCYQKHNHVVTLSPWLFLYFRRLGDVLRRKRYSKRPSRGKATSIASTSDAFVGDVARQQIGVPSSKTMLHESRASFLASQSSRLSCRSSVLSERPAKVQHKKAVPRASLRVGRGGRGHPFFFEIWYNFYRILRKNEKYLYSW